MGGQKVEAVERALAILGAFAAGKPSLTLAELAQATGFYKSTILRLAGSLEGNGYLIRDDAGTFRLGPALGRLGALYRSGFKLADVIRPELRRVVEATGEGMRSETENVSHLIFTLCVEMFFKNRSISLII